MQISQLDLNRRLSNASWGGFVWGALIASLLWNA
jgi:hypothetical protein